MKPKTTWIVLAVIICFAVAAIGFSAIILTIKWEKSVEAHNTTKRTLGVTKEQLRICESNLLTFKNLDEKNTADIESYILANYKRVSYIVAKEISVRTVELAAKHGLAVPILMGMMEVESNFGPHAVSKKQARGLMQVRWKVWGDTLKEQGFTDHHQLHQINTGIEAGIIVFRHYMKQNDDNLSKALYDYVGKSNEYVTKVYSAMGKFVLHGVSTMTPATEGYVNEE